MAYMNMYGTIFTHNKIGCVCMCEHHHTHKKAKVIATNMLNVLCYIHNIYMMSHGSKMF